MGQEYGDDWRLQIGDGGGTEVFSNIGGEVSFDWKRSSKEVDIATKDDGVYGANTYLQQTITISVSGKLKLPDVGLQRASDVSKALPPQANVKIKKGTTVKLAGAFAIGNFSISAPKGDVVTYSFDMSNVGAPTTDNLGA
jgi:hypothetical protein